MIFGEKRELTLAIMLRQKASSMRKRCFLTYFIARFR